MSSSGIMASHWDFPFWWTCCVINMMKLGAQGQLFERSSKWKALQVLLSHGGGMHSTHLVLSKESGQEVVKIWWNLVTSVCKSGRLVLQLHWASTSSQLDLPPTKTESFVPVPGAKDPGAWLEHRSTFGVPGLPCLLVAVKAWKRAELLYLKSWTFQTYQNSPIKNSPLPRNVRIWCCKSSTKTSWDRSQRVP